MHAETMTSTAGPGMRGQWAIVVLAAALAMLATLKLTSADIPPPIPPTFAFDPARSDATEAAASWTGPHRSEGMGNLDMVHGAEPLDSTRGTQLAMLTLVFGGIPAALVAIAFAAARGTTPGSWDERWYTSFLLGLIFQASHLAVLIVPALLVVAIDPLESLTRTIFLVTSILASVIALPQWRRLQLAAVARPRLR